VTNEIPQFPLKHKNNMRNKVAKVSVKDSTLCVVCEFGLSKIDEELKDDATEVRKFVYKFMKFHVL
jgi:hypothetical protein